MIRDYADHAASERTFLAWLRTGIAVVAFGFLIEKFDLFALTMEGATPSTRRGVSISKNFRGRLVSAPGTRSLSSAFSSYWARPSASCARGDCWMTKRCTRLVSSLTWPLG